MTQPNTNANVVLSANVQPYQQSMQAAGSSTKELLGTLGQVSTAIDGIFKKAGHRLELFSAGSLASIGAAVASLSQLDAALSKIRATTSLTSGGTNIGHLSSDLRALSTQIPMSTSQLTALATTISDMGVKGSDNISKLTKTFAQLQQVTGESGSAMAQDLIQLSRAMGQSIDPGRMKQYASAVANVSANLGTSATAVTNFAQAIQPMGKVLGISETQLIGISGAFSKAGASGTAAATAFSQIAQIITNDIQTGNPQIKQFADLLGLTVNQFASLEKSDPSKTLSALFTQLNKQGPKSIAILQSLGLDGVRSLNAIQQVAQGGGLQQGIDAATAGANDPSKLTKAASKSFDDLQSQLKLLGATMKELTTGPFVTLERGLTKILEAVNGVVKVFTDLANAPGIHFLLQMAGALAPVGSIIIGLGGALLSLLPTLALLGTLWRAIFSQSGISVVGGFKDAVRGVSNSAAATAMAASRAGTGPQVGMMARGAYAAGGALGSGARMAGVRLPASSGVPGGPGMGSRIAGAGMAGARMAANSLVLRPSGLFVAGAGALATGGMPAVAAQAFNRTPSTPALWARTQAGRVGNWWNGLGSSGTATPPSGAGVGGGSPTVISDAAKREAEAASKVEKSFQTVEKRAAPLGSAFAAATTGAAKEAEASEANAKAKATEAEASEANAKAKVTETEETTAASSALAVFAKTALSAGAAGVGEAAKGLGKGASAVGGFAAANPIMMGVLAAGVVIPSAISANKHISQDDISQDKGSFIGGLNSMNSATGEATTSLKDLTDATKKQADAALNVSKPWSDQEIATAKDAAFKAVGYDNNQKTTVEKKAALLESETAKISTGGPLSAADQTQFREQLLHLLPVDEAKTTYDNLNKATAGFSQAPKDLSRITNDYQALGQSYLNNVNDTLKNPKKALNFASPWNSKQSQVAMDKLVSPLGLLNAQSSGADVGSAAQQMASSQFGSALVGASSSISGNHFGGIGAPSGTAKSFYDNLAKSMGLKGVSGGKDVTNLSEFVNRMYGSKDENTRNTAQRLFGDKGSIDFSDPNKATQQLQSRLDAASQKQAAQTTTTDNKNYSDYNLGAIGVKQGSATAIAAGQKLSATVPAGQANKVDAQAIYGSAQALMAQSHSAESAEAALSKWSGALSSTDPTVTAFATSVRQVADSLIDASRATMSLPQQIADVASEMSKLDLNAPGASDRYASLQQTLQQDVGQGVQQAQQYLLAKHQQSIQLAQGAEDYSKQVSRANTQFALQEDRSRDNQQRQTSRSIDDFHTQELRAQDDFQLSMSQSQDDYRKSQDRATRDFVYQESQYVKSVAESMDPWAQVQARSVTDAQQALANMQQQNKLLAQGASQLSQLKNMGVSQNVIDVLGLSDPKNLQQLNRFFVDLGNNPQLVQSFNDSIKDRLDWTQGLATDESSTQWQEMEHQFNQAANDAADDFKTTSDRASAAFAKQQSRSEDDFNKMLNRNSDDFARMTAQSEADFGTQMSNMQTDYETSVQRSLDAINDFATEAYGTTEQIMNAAMETSSGNMQTFFQNVSAAYNAMKAGVDQGTAAGIAAAAGGSASPGTASNPITTAGQVGINPSGQVGSYNAAGQFSAFIGPVDPGKMATMPHIDSPTAQPATGTPDQNKAWAKWYMQQHYGWGADQFAALDKLWTNESGWRQSAHNASGAHGIPQSLPANKMASFGADYMTNPVTQMKWGLDYIAGRYGNPVGASNFEFSHTPHWYAAGAIFNGPQQIGVGEAGSEMVLPLNNRGVDFLLTTARQLNSDAWAARNSNQYASKVTPTITNTNVDSSTNFNGPVTVQAQDPNAMANALKAKARMQALTRPDMVSGLI